jgi:hypothetical protein
MPLNTKSQEYLIHGTQIKNAINILQSKTILANPPQKYKVVLADWAPTKQIFTQLIYPDIPNEKYNKPGWGNLQFVLSKQLLKDYPFYATEIGGFLDNFKDAFSTDDIIIKSPKGGLSRMPNLTKLKNHINDYCKNSDLDGLEYMHSNEILFNQDIPLDKYCVAIIAGKYTSDKEHQQLAKLCADLEIPYHRIENDNKKGIPYGLNKFLDLVAKVISN